MSTDQHPMMPANLPPTAASRPGECGTLLWLALLALLFGLFSASYFTLFTVGLVMTADRDVLPWLLPLLYLAAGLAGSAVRIGVPGLVQRWLFHRQLWLFVGAPPLFAVGFVVGALFLFDDESLSVWLFTLLFVSIPASLSLLDFAFWRTVDRVFDAEQCQRRGRWVEVLAVAGMALGFLAFGLGIEFPLLLLAPVLLILSPLPLWRLAKRRFPGAETAARPPPTAVECGLAELVHNRYILMMVGIALLLVLTHYLVDYGLLVAVQTEFNEEEAMMVLPFLFFIAAIVELLFRAIGRRWLTHRLGPTYGLLLLPATLLLTILLLSTLVTDLDHGEALLLLLLLTKPFETAIRGVAVEPSFNALFLPLPAPIEAAARRVFQRWVWPLVLAITSGALLCVGFGFEVSYYGMNELSTAWFASLVVVLCLLLAAAVATTWLYRKKINESLDPDLAFFGQNHTYFWTL